jgi:hypothetical protein
MYTQYIHSLPQSRLSTANYALITSSFCYHGSLRHLNTACPTLYMHIYLVVVFTTFCTALYFVLYDLKSLYRLQPAVDVQLSVRGFGSSCTDILTILHLIDLRSLYALDTCLNSF